MNIYYLTQFCGPEILELLSNIVVKMSARLYVSFEGLGQETHSYDC